MYAGVDPLTGRELRLTESTTGEAKAKEILKRFRAQVDEQRHARTRANETYVELSTRWVYLYRAIDQFGQVIDVLVSEKRDLAATCRFFTGALEHGPVTTEVNTDRVPAYPRVLDELLPASPLNRVRRVRTKERVTYGGLAWAAVRISSVSYVNVLYRSSA
jgi:transposase-like protein